MKLLISFITLASILLFFGTSAYAYIGPGMGGGVIAITLGFIAAVFLAFFGILYYPIKRVINKRRNKNKDLKKSNDES